MFPDDDDTPDWGGIDLTNRKNSGFYTSRITPQKKDSTPQLPKCDHTWAFDFEEVQKGFMGRKIIIKHYHCERNGCNAKKTER